MRKPRDFDAELKALNDRARHLKERKVQQLGELVVATGADRLSIEELAGLLLASVERDDPGKKENWRKRGAAFFQQRAGSSADSTRRDAGGAARGEGSTSPPGSQSRTN